MAVWPVTLPLKPLVSGYSVKNPNINIRTQMDEGEIKVRRKFSNAEEPRSVAFLMTQTQLTEFKNFWKNTLKGGVDRYDWADPEDGVTKQWRIIDYSYSTSGSGANFNVNVNLELMP